MTQKIFDSDGIKNSPESAVKEMLDGRITLTRTPSDSGLFHTTAPQKHADVIAAANEFRLSNHGSMIRMCTDRPDSLASGYGAKSGQRCATIDFCVGPMAAARGGKGPRDGEKINPSFSTDAARIYLSQLTDADKNFGIAGEPHDARSAFVAKADVGRVIGREGVKIVTGKSRGVRAGGGSRVTGETNSLGAKIIRPAPTIELIAGNNSGFRTVFGGVANPLEQIDYLQPTVLGLNTRDAFREMAKIVSEIWSAVFNLSVIQTLYNAILSIDPFRPWVPTGFAFSLSALLNYVINSLYHTRTNSALFELNFTTPAGYKYVCSRNVKTT